MGRGEMGAEAVAGAAPTNLTSLAGFPDFSPFKKNIGILSLGSYLGVGKICSLSTSLA